MERNGASKPSWWPDSVSFSKNLTVDQKSSQNQKGMVGVFDTDAVDAVT